MESVKLGFLDKNYHKYSETYDAFIYFQKALEELTIEGLLPLIELLKIDLKREKKRIKSKNRRDKIWVQLSNFGHPSIGWLGGGIKFEDGVIEPSLYLYVSSKAKNSAGIIGALGAALPGDEYETSPSDKKLGITIKFRKNHKTNSISELQSRIHALSSAVAKVLSKVL